MFQARVDALGLGDRVTLAGEIADGRKLLPGFDLFALPSKLEGSSNALAEAMIAGAATVTTPVADAQQLAGGAAIVSTGWTPSAFGDALLAAVEDAPALRERARERGRNLLLEQSPERVGSQWARLISEAVGLAQVRRGVKVLKGLEVRSSMPGQ
jgi:glycosyltransferase involved in cell wall biosynthesis